MSSPRPPPAAGVPHPSPAPRDDVVLSVLVPVLDEERTVAEVLRRLLAVELGCGLEVVVVDDGSSDATPALLAAAAAADDRVVVRTHPQPRGKGAAIRTAAHVATGTHVVPLDADLEYMPEDLPALVEPVLSGAVDVVFGVRGFASHTAYSFWYVMGNRGVTLAANVLFDAYVHDVETCFKLLPRPLYLDLDVRSTGFGMEAEITAKLLRRGLRPYEVPVSYRARTRAAGKKLTWRDGVEALAVLARERVRRVPPTDPAPPSLGR